jgi:elongation factor P--(R)-beta-lysine ligase
MAGWSVHQRPEGVQLMSEHGRPPLAGTRDRDPGDAFPTATLDMLRLRAALLGWLRRFFDAQGYLEVETPILSHDVVVDAHLEPFVSHWLPNGGVQAGEHAAPGVEVFLQTSPEFAMKRLLAAGANAVYQVTHAFRNGELGRLHNPEFTLVEWYRAADTHHAQMDFTEELVAAFYSEAAARMAECGVRAARCTQPSWPGTGPPPRPFRRMTYDDAFAAFAGRRVLDCSVPELMELARRPHVPAPPEMAADDRDAWLNLLLAEVVEPQLGAGPPVFVYDYPASQAALARRRPDDPRVAERFELYVDAIEICNGYHELLDPAELRQRSREQSARRAREGRRELPLENRLLEAMHRGLPASSGVALGFDRLLMTAVGARTLAEVMAFPFERA